jgi:hypothetical protein
MFPQQLAPGETLYFTLELADASGVSTAYLNTRHTETGVYFNHRCTSGGTYLSRVSGTQKNGTWSTFCKLPVSAMNSGKYSVEAYFSDVLGQGTSVSLGDFTVIQAQVNFRHILFFFIRANTTTFLHLLLFFVENLKQRSYICFYVWFRI